MENHHFSWENSQFLWKNTIFNGKIHYFYGKSPFFMGKFTISMAMIGCSTFQRHPAMTAHPRLGRSLRRHRVLAAGARAGRETLRPTCWGGAAWGPGVKVEKNRF